MNRPFLGELFGNSIRWQKKENGLEIRLSPFESLTLPVLVGAFSIFFAVGSFSDGEIVQSYFSVFPLLVTVWLYWRGRRRIILNTDIQEVELAVGPVVKRRISTSRIGMSIQKARVWDSQTDGPLYFTTHVLLLGEQSLLSVRSLGTLERLAEEIRCAGFTIVRRDNLERVNH